MSIQHKDIANENLHEPKGVSAASSGTTYTANGGGSGTWELPLASPIGALSSYVFVADGEDSGRWEAQQDSADPVNAAVDTVFTADGSGAGSWSIIEHPTYTVAVDEELTSVSTATSQEPTAKDTPIQIEFGAALVSSSGRVSMSSLGAFTFNEGGSYLIDVDLCYGRTGGSGTSELYTRRLLNGVQFGTSFHAKLDDGDVYVPVSRSCWFVVEAGDIVTFELMRDSAGYNSGGLFSTTPTLTGWNIASSAVVSIQHCNSTKED